jgi:hypothetical protein
MKICCVEADIDVPAALDDIDDALGAGLRCGMQAHRPHGAARGYGDQRNQHHQWPRPNLYYIVFQ